MPVYCCGFIKCKKEFCSKFPKVLFSDGEVPGDAGYLQVAAEADCGPPQILQRRCPMLFPNIIGYIEGKEIGVVNKTPDGIKVDVVGIDK